MAINCEELPLACCTWFSILKGSEFRVKITVGCSIDHGQTTDPLQLKLCLSHKRRLASNADMGFYCVNIMTKSFSSPERIVWTIMSGIITVTRLMSSLGIKDHWVKWIYLWFIYTLYAKRTQWNYMYIYFIAKKCKFLKGDRGIYFKSCVLKLTDSTKQN